MDLTAHHKFLLDISIGQYMTIMYTDFLTDMRILARESKNWALSDQIRNELDSRGSFCIDGPEGQEVYHMGKGWTRQRLLDNIKNLNEFHFNKRKTYEWKQSITNNGESIC